jgi:hypothetical protein
VTPVALCSFSQSVGWRIAAVSRSDLNGIGIFKFGNIKLLRVPIDSTLKAGRFCNPRRLVNV